MSYTPPLNGGRINVTLSGNSTSAGGGYALASTGTVTLAGGNNITLSQNGNAITISGANVGGAAGTNTLGMSNLGNTSGTTGVITGSNLQMAIAGGNNVTLSQSIDVSSATITVSAANQTVQTQNLHNLTLAGNSTSAGAGYIQISSGTATLAGGNNITLSQNGNAVTISAFNQSVQTQNLIDVTLAGNSTSAGAGYALMSSGTMTLAGGNNITLSQNGNAVTVSGANQSNPNVSLYALGNTTQNSSTQLNVSNLSFNGLGAATMGYSNGSIQVSVPTQTVQTQSRFNLTLAGNSTSAGAGYAQISSGTMTLAGGNNITLNQDGNAVTVAGPYAITQAGISNLGNTAGTTATQGNKVLMLAGGNNVTLSQSVSTDGFGGGSATVTISAFNQSNQTAGLYAVSNTTQSSSATVDARSLSFGGAGIASVGATNGSVVISVPAGGGAGFSAGISNLGNTAGTSGTTDNSLILAGGNNITVSQNTGPGGNTVTISGPDQSVQTVGLYALGNTTQNSSTTLDARTMSFNGLGAATMGYSNGSIQVSVPSVQTFSTWDLWPLHNTGTAVLSGATNTSGSASFIPFILPVNAKANYLEMIMSMNLTTGGTSTYSQSGTANYGVYSRNASTLSQITSGSWSWQVSYNNSTITVSQPTSTDTAGYTYGSTTSAGLNLSSGYTGLKLIQMPISSVLTPGNYWVGLFNRASTTGFNSGVLVSYYGNAYSLTGLAPIGSFSSANTTGTNLYGGSRNWLQGFGVFTSAAQTNLPSSVDISALSQNVSVIPYMKLIAR